MNAMLYMYRCYFFADQYYAAPYSRQTPIHSDQNRFHRKFEHP